MTSITKNLKKLTLLFLKRIILAIFLKVRKLYYYYKLFCTKYKILDETVHSFKDYAKLVSSFYGKPDDLVIGKISKELLNDIESNFLTEANFLNSNNILNSCNDIHPILSITKNEINITNELKKNLIAETCTTIITQMKP